MFFASYLKYLYLVTLKRVKFKLTCNLTFDVSMGNVTNSAKEAARPALTNLIPVEVSNGLKF